MNGGPQNVPFLWTGHVMLSNCRKLFAAYYDLNEAVKGPVEESRDKEKWPNPSWKPHVLDVLLQPIEEAVTELRNVVNYLANKPAWGASCPRKPANCCKGIRIDGTECCSRPLKGSAFCRHHQYQASTAEDLSALVGDLATTLRPRCDS
jgi:hypothetical protein